MVYKRILREGKEEELNDINAIYTLEILFFSDLKFK